MLIFDIETNGLLDECTQLHCMCIRDTKDGKMYKCEPTTVQYGVTLLKEALEKGEQICGHNIINFDIPALEKLYPWFKVTQEQKAQIVDTLVLSRLIYSNLDTMDIGLMRSGKLPPKLYKSHSLKAWGYRLGILKGTYGEQEEAWAVYTPEMLEYNEQDVVVTEMLLNTLMSSNYSQTAIGIEHQVACLMAKQEQNGFPFDRQKAEALECTLRSKYALLHTQLICVIPQIPAEIFVPKRNNKTKGYIAGVPIQRYKDFNPGSRQQLLWLLKEHFGYMPECEDLYKEENGNLKMDDETFSFIKEDTNAPAELRELAKVFSEFFVIVKRLGQLADGKQAWLKNIKPDGKVHGRVTPNGAISGRATHSNPNVAQVPSVGAPFGSECRELFNSGEWFQAGIDASGLELRCLAHFMHPFDEGEYAQEILKGDIHTKNQQAAGLPTRGDAKTFIYQFLYGAGDYLIGRTINGTAADGKRIKRQFLKATPAIADLKNTIQGALADMERGQVKKWKRRYLKGLDGRLLHVRSLHSALNLLLQSAGALICKKWIVRTEERLLQRGLKHGWEGDFAYMAWVHKHHCAR